MNLSKLDYMQSNYLVIEPIKINIINNLSNEQNDEHYKGHYLKYIEKLNGLVNNNEKLKKINKIIVEKYNNSRSDYLTACINSEFFKEDDPVYRNATQILNHELYWNSITTKEESLNSLTNVKNKYFLDDNEFNEFKKKFVDEGLKHFGSGWLWIYITSCLENKKKLDIVTTHDSIIPNIRYIVCVDLWEHAFYIDYKSKKQAYLEGAFDSINWNKFLI
jgi:Fe-Mn family superoxide dismutase